MPFETWQILVDWGVLEGLRSQVSRWQKPLRGYRRRRAARLLCQLAPRAIATLRVNYCAYEYDIATSMTTLQGYHNALWPALEQVPYARILQKWDGMKRWKSTYDMSKRCKETVQQQ